MAIEVVKTAVPKPKPHDAGLQFGELFTDHLYLADWQSGKGWHSERIVPYGPRP